jgi:hypothetical protein
MRESLHNDFRLSTIKEMEATAGHGDWLAHHLRVAHLMQKAQGIGIPTTHSPS